MKKPLYPAFTVLLVDDEPSFLRSLSILLERKARINNIQSCNDSRRVMEVIAQGHVGLVLLDLTMPHLSGEVLLKNIAEEYPQIGVIVISGMNQLETAVRCMRLGAYDYYVKTTEEDRLVSGVHRAIQALELKQENMLLRKRFLNDTLECPDAFADIVTCDKKLRSVFQYLESVAKSTQPLLVTGETGVGKELIIQATHRLSGVKGNLVTLNVAGLDDDVFADTLFGHCQGAYTGATNARNGMISKANHGTLFLDEIGDLSSLSQVKLLRLLQNGEYYPLGSDNPSFMQARVVVATNRNIGKLQHEGKFRKDLYYRLRTHHVNIPPLRERRADIALILHYFLKKASDEINKKVPRIPKELPVLLSNYNFPGNVRELKAMVYDAINTHRSGILSMNAFKRAMQPLSAMSKSCPPNISDQGRPFETIEQLPLLAEVEKILIREAVQRSKGNQSIASRLLGISQPALSKRLKKLSSRSPS
jgi:DNA-binding NtrC family response regulator